MLALSLFTVVLSLTVFCPPLAVGAGGVSPHKTVGKVFAALVLFPRVRIKNRNYINYYFYHLLSQRERGGGAFVRCFRGGLSS